MSNDEIIFRGKTEAIYKIIVVGDPGVGKSELIAKFATNQFEEKYLPSVGVSILKQPIELKAYNAKVYLMFWDIAGQPQFYMLHRPYFNGADGMLLVFDLTRSNTFSNINSWYNSAVKYGLSGIPRILIGNKAHLTEERKIILPMVENLAEKLNASYYETSPLSGENFKEAFKKIGELVYKAKTLNIAWKNLPLIFKEYEGPTQPSSSASYSLENEYDTTQEVSIVESYSINPSIEMDKRKRRALETVFRRFKGSRLGKSQSMPITATEMGNLVILASKYKFQTVLAFIFGFFFILLFWALGLLALLTDDERAYGLGLTASGVRIVLILLSVLVLGVGGRLIVFALNLRHYFIVLHYRGIYYKKIGKPRFLSWADIAWIVGYLRYVRGRPTERAVKIHLKSNKKVHFNSTNYLFEDNFIDFDEVFYSCEFRRCPFYSI
ncbi:MAG: GTP-binding protein [Candidatus Lokiarchaeota archaeon]|nr:GTP-binding protein [Candidatus Lokiarchaeota archaeon]